MIVKLKPAISLESMKRTLAAFNSLHGADIRKLFAFDGKIIWSEHAQEPSKEDQREILPSIDLKLQNASSKNYRELVHMLLSFAQNSTVERVFNFGMAEVTVEWNKLKRKRSHPVTVTFPTVETARAFHYQFKDYEWESDDCSQTIIVELQHDMFDKELRNPHVRNAVTAANVITPEHVKSIVGGISA